MTTTGVSRRDRRALIVGGLTVCLLLLFFRAAPSWSGWRADQRTEWELAVEELLAHRESIDELPATVDSAEARIARIRALAPALLAGKGESEIAAEFRSLVSGIARRSRVAVDEFNVSVDSTGRGYLARATATFRGRSDVSGLAQFVLTVEREPTILTVRRLVVRSEAFTTTNDEVEQLELDVTVAALAFVDGFDAETADESR